MIDVEFKIDFSGLEKDLKAFESQRLKVGVLDHEANARKPMSKKAGLTSLKGAQGYQRRKLSRKNTNLKLTALAELMDAKYGFISNAFEKAGNKELNQLFDQFSLMLSNKQINQKRIENAGIAIIRNPILRMEYGKNKRSTEQAKGFNRPIVDTGTLFSNIKALYYLEG